MASELDDLATDVPCCEHRRAVDGASNAGLRVLDDRDDTFDEGGDLLSLGERSRRSPHC
jgi:hypothetical protein